MQQAIYALSRASRCYACDGKQEAGDLVRLQEGKDEKRCSAGKCAGLSDFILIPAGNAKVTRLAKKHAKVHYVVLKWSELWKTYERTGLLVEPTAAEIIERESGVKVGGKQ